MLLGGACSPPCHIWLLSGAVAAPWRCPAEFSGQHGSVLAPSPVCLGLIAAGQGLWREPLAAARGQRAAVRSWAEQRRGGGNGAAPCPGRAEQMSLCGASRGAGTCWYPLPALPAAPALASSTAAEEAGRRFPGGCRCPPHPGRRGADVPPLLCPAQGPPAHQPAAVPGPVRRGHPVPAGDGVLPAGESRASPRIPSRSPRCHRGAGAQAPASRYRRGDCRAAGRACRQGCRQGRVHGSALPCWARLSPQRGEGDSGTALQGDLKGYLRSCRGAEAMTPDPLTLQRMACEVACGVLHLHRNNYIHR